VRPMAIAVANRDGKATRRLVWIASSLVVLADIGYVWIIESQGSGPPDSTVPFLVVYMGLIAAMLALSLSDHRRVVSLRPLLRAAAGGGLLVLGPLAAMSIGLLVLIAGGLATAAAIRTLAFAPGTRTMIVEAVAAATAVVILLAGLQVAGRIIFCPSHGEMGGTGGLLITFSWSCVDGHLDIHSG
jgi:hypothetical protein